MRVPPSKLCFYMGISNHLRWHAFAELPLFEDDNNDKALTVASGIYLFNY